MAVEMNTVFQCQAGPFRCLCLTVLSQRSLRDPLSIKFISMAGIVILVAMSDGTSIRAIEIRALSQR